MSSLTTWAQQQDSSLKLHQMLKAENNKKKKKTREYTVALQ